MRTKKVTLRKIPLENLLEILADLYEKGFDYIDLVCSNLEENDKISIFVKEEYMSEEEEDEDMEFPTEVESEKRPNREIKLDDNFDDYI